ncbi:glycosyltransferase family 4 protein [Neobacillus sp. SAB-20_R2A]|uniref:glycosyltransferase family 4 protein n=1 Tax=Neobacillus sp. SAB-20_R2A TaxID=3120519 RepID=UPI003C6E96D2
MKICFITTVPITLKTFVLETAKYLYDKEKIDITFICDLDESFAQNLPEYINYVPIKMTRGISLSGIPALLKMYLLFKKENFDLIQYATPNASLYASIAGFLAGIPKRLYCQWGIRYVGMEGTIRGIFKILEKAICVLSTDIRAVSKKNLEFALSEKLYKMDKAKVIGEGGTIGVDLNQFDLLKKDDFRKSIRKQYGILDEFVFGFVGRLSRDKGANELLACIKKLAETSKVKLFIIGDMEVDKNVSLDLLTWAKNSETVIFTGQKNQNDLVRYYAAFDCLVHPTYREGFGMVLQEAAAMECPIITTDIPGASEVMENGKSCLLAEARDYKSLYKLMEKIISDNHLSKLLGTNARKRIEEYFDRTIMIENQYKDYISLIKS